MKKYILLALLLMVATLQTALAQGFRVYKSDGTVAQFSLRTDSIVFYDGLGSDVDFGPFTPVNQCIAGKWYRYRKEYTFSEDGKTNYPAGTMLPYKFMPYQGKLIVYRTNGTLRNILHVYDLTADTLVVGAIGSTGYSVLTRTSQPQPVTSITLSDDSLSLQPDTYYQLTATVLPADADNPAVTWTSSNTDVASVYEDGLVRAKANGSCIITCSAKDGSGVKATCKVTVVDNTRGITDGHEWVDLGLPSGTLWATCNIGASSPEETGNYYAWGETSTKSSYKWNNYKYGTQFDLTKYSEDNGVGNYGLNDFIDNKNELEPSDDAATVNWSGNWQIPSKDQGEELLKSSYTTITGTTQNGVSGFLIKSKNNGNSIFLPATGYLEGTSIESNTRGCYWIRVITTYSNTAFNLDLNPSNSFYQIGNRKRSDGLAVRPVVKK